MANTETELVGVLNLTPDSFSDGGIYSTSTDKAINRTYQLYSEGAAIVDVGAESTRPGATPLTSEQEIERLTPYIDYASLRGWRLSLDTHHASTVRYIGQRITRLIINDVTGFVDSEMREAAAELGSPVIMSHLPLSAGGDIQLAHKTRPVDSAQQVLEELDVAIELLVRAGVADGNIIADPGIGFGKTPAASWALLEFAQMMPEREVMVGYSRKRFLGENRFDIGPNLEAGRIAVASGAKYLRVHDVAGHRQLVS